MFFVTKDLTHSLRWQDRKSTMTSHDSSVNWQLTARPRPGQLFFLPTASVLIGRCCSKAPSIISFNFSSFFHQFCFCFKDCRFCSVLLLVLVCAGCPFVKCSWINYFVINNYFSQWKSIYLRHRINKDHGGIKFFLDEWVIFIFRNMQPLLEGAALTFATLTSYLIFCML
jgi:hypothetical protein